MPAERFGLKTKGRLTVGADADITIFNPQKIADKATYQDPDIAPEGIQYVFITTGSSFKIWKWKVP
jgi:N-acyl-D-amino-acid deacylase